MSNTITFIIENTNSEYTVSFNDRSISVLDAVYLFNTQNNFHGVDAMPEDVTYIGDDAVYELSDELIERMRLQDGDTVTICNEEIESVICAEAEAEAAPQQSAAAARNDDVAYVTVMYGAGIANLRIAIVPGVTTIEEIATSSLTLARLAKSRDAVLRCKFTVDGVERGAEYKLPAEATLRIEDRVAGDKGSARCVTLDFGDGTTVTVGLDVTDEDTLQTVVESALWANFPIMKLQDGSVITPDNFCEYIEAIEDIQGGDIVRRLFRTLPIDNGICITMFDNVIRVPADNTVEFESATAVAPAATYTCTICLGSGINPFVRSFRQGSTLAEVLLDPTVLARLNQRESDVRNSKVTVNGTEYTNFNILLDDNATVRVEARVAGDKGI